MPAFGAGFLLRCVCGGMMRTLVLMLAGAGVLVIAVSLALRLMRDSARADAWLGLGFLLLLPVFAFRLYGYLYPPTAEQLFEQRYGPREVAGLYGERFVSAEQRTRYFDLVIESRNEAGERWMVDQLIDDTLVLGRWMARHSSRAPPGDVAVTARTNLVDRYGNISRHEVVTLRWAEEDWSKVNWGSISPLRLAELSELLTVHPAARPAVADWCRSSKARWRFC